MKQHTDQEERRGLIANLFAKAPRVPDPAPVPPPARPQAPARRERREPDPTPAEEAALRRRAQEWQQAYDRQQAQRQSRHNGHGAYCAPSGTCTPTRFHVTGHPHDATGHEQYRPGLFARLFGARDKGIGRGDGS